MFDLQVLVPWHPFDKWQPRAEFFAAHGLQNIGSARLHLVLLIGPNDAEPDTSWAKACAKVSVVRCPSQDAARKIYHFYAHVLGVGGAVPVGLDSRAYLRVDDDSITDVTALLAALPEGDIWHVGDWECSVWGVYKPLLRERGYDPDDGTWMHCWEASVTSRAAIQQILANESALQVLAEATHIENGVGDNVLDIACRFAGVPIGPLAVMSGAAGAWPNTAAPVERFTRFGGDLAHVHYIAPDLEPAYAKYLQLCAGEGETVSRETVLPALPTDNAAPQLSVIIPVATDATRLRWALHGLTMQSVQQFEIIVALDNRAFNGSDPHQSVRDVVSEFQKHFGDRLQLAEVGQWSKKFRAAATRNAGAKHSKAPVLMFLDADCVPMPRCVELHLEQLRFCGSLTVVQGTRHLLSESDFASQTDWTLPQLWQQSARFLQRGQANLDDLLSFCISMRADLFCEVGGFRDDYEGWGGEDTALGRDLARAGAQLTELFTEPADYAVSGDCVHLGHPMLKPNDRNFSDRRIEREAKTARPQFQRLIDQT